MSRVKKSFVADDEQGGSGMTRSTIKSSMLEILVKLGKIGGYNAAGNIRGDDNDFVDGTDIGALVTYAVTPEKLLRGKKEFVNLLAVAGIAPLKIANENLRRHMPPIIERISATPSIIQTQDRRHFSPEPMEDTVIIDKRKRPPGPDYYPEKRLRVDSAPEPLPPPPPLQLMVHPAPQQQPQDAQSATHANPPKEAENEAVNIPLPDTETTDAELGLNTRGRKNKSTTKQFQGLKSNRYEPYGRRS